MIHNENNQDESSGAGALIIDFERRRSERKRVMAERKKVPPSPDEREARIARDAETFSLERYTSAALNPELSERAVYGAIVVSMVRALHSLDADTQRRILAKEPPLTGKRRWDALAAASAEHFATRHGHRPAPWMRATERFLKEPWIASDSRGYSRWEALLYCPGAFTRHGTPVHPSDLDPRGGSAAWRPDCCEAWNPEEYDTGPSGPAQRATQ